MTIESSYIPPIATPLQHQLGISAMDSDAVHKEKEEAEKPPFSRKGLRGQCVGLQLY